MILRMQNDAFWRILTEGFQKIRRRHVGAFDASPLAGVEESNDLGRWFVEDLGATVETRSCSSSVVDEEFNDVGR